MPWRRRDRPVFEERWGCTSRCLTALVRSALLRESPGPAAPGPAAAHRHRVPLGLMLLAQGWITHPQLQRALQAQRADSASGVGEQRIGDRLMQSCGIAEERILRALALQWSCPVLTAHGFSPNAMALVMPKRLIAEFNILPLQIAGSRLIYLAFADRPNPATALAVAKMSSLRVEHGIIATADYDRTRAAILAADGISIRMGQAADLDALCTQVVKALEQHQPVAARVVRVHHYYWLRMWLERGALTGLGSVPAGRDDVQDVLFTVAGSGREVSND